MGWLEQTEKLFYDGGQSLLNQPRRTLYASRLAVWAVVRAREVWTVLRAGELMAALDGAEGLPSPLLRRELAEAKSIAEVEKVALRHAAELESRICAMADYHHRHVERGGDRGTSHWLETGVPVEVLKEVAALHALAPRTYYLQRETEDRAVAECRDLFEEKDILAGEWRGRERGGMNPVQELLERLPMEEPSRDDWLRPNVAWCQRHLRPRGPDESYYDFTMRQPYGEFVLRKFGTDWPQQKKGQVDVLTEGALAGLLYSIDHYTPIRPSEPERQGELFGHQDQSYYCPPLTRAIEMGVHKHLYQTVQDSMPVSVSREVWSEAYKMGQTIQEMVKSGMDREEAARQLGATVLERSRNLSPEERARRLMAFDLARSEGNLAESLEAAGDRKRYDEGAGTTWDENEAMWHSAAAMREDRPFVVGEATINLAGIYGKMLNPVLQAFHGADPKAILGLRMAVMGPSKPLPPAFMESIAGHLERNDRRDYLSRFLKFQKHWSLVNVRLNPDETPGVVQLTSERSALDRVSDALSNKVAKALEKRNDQSMVEMFASILERPVPPPGQAPKRGPEAGPKPER